MGFAVDEVADVVKQRGDFENQAEVGAHFMNRAELIEEAERELGDLFGVLGAVIETTGEPASAGEKFVGAAALLFAGDADRILLGDKIEQDAFANANAGDQHGAEVEPFGEGGENDRGDAHDFGAVFADAIGAHAAGNVEGQHAPGLIAEQAGVDGGYALGERAGGEADQSFGIATAGDGEGAREFGRRGHGAAQ